MMRRSPLRRIGKKTAARMAHGTPRRPLPARNPERQEASYRRNYAGPLPGDYRLRIVVMPCAACGRRAPSEPAHVRARGMGGAKGCWRDLAPLCGPRFGDVGCHRLFDGDRAAFRARFPGLDLAAIAAELAAAYLAELGLAVDAPPALR